MMSPAAKSNLREVSVGLAILALYGVAAFGATTMRDHDVRINRMEVRQDEAALRQAARDADIIRALAGVDKRLERIEDRLNAAVRGP
jgi:hypothetical protein